MFKHNSAQQLLLQSNQFDTAVTYLEQLLFQKAYFSQQLLFQNSYLFGAKVLLTTSINSSSLGQLVFQNSYYKEDKFIQNINIDRRISFSKQTLLQNIKVFQGCIKKLFKYQRWITCLRKNTPSQIFQRVLNLFFQNSRFFNKVAYSKETFSEQLLFWKCYFFRKPIERKIYFFRVASF